ncbi:MAG: ABC transporter substrate-binding protein [Candidatus Bipolaricaulota bacterium]|nr:ABC transporter substrate-binding protein [Candidatus Bipolaricaulota bacterium]MBS3792499.1 ABC transporter substrate-binding protein [Candidatus Bipolaricaulota bacterium]
MRASPKNILLTSLVLITLLFGLSGVGQAAEEPISIGITQIVEHPALNAVRDAVIDTVTSAGYERGEDVKFLLKNAQGDMNNAVSIAQTFKSEGVDYVVTIATPTSVAAAQVLKETPLVVSAVTNFVEAGLVESFEDYENPENNGNITGISDQVPVKAQFELIEQLVPSVEKVGNVFNSGEANSAFLTKLARQVTDEMGIDLVEATASSSAEVSAAAKSLRGRVDAVWISTDNTVVSALPVVSKMTKDEGIPLVVADPTSVKEGSIAGYGFDYYSHGLRAGDILLEVMGGKAPNEVPIQVMQAEDLTLALNMDYAREIDYRFPAEVLEQANQFILAGQLWTKGSE